MATTTRAGDHQSHSASEPPRSVLRIVNLLGMIAERPEGVTLAALSRLLEAPKSSLSNLLRGLVAGDYVRNDNGVFTLAEESFHLAAVINRGSRLPQFARGVIGQLTAATGETSVLGILTPDDRVMFVERAISTKTLAVHTQIGEWRALHDSASGRAILAMFSPERIDAYLAASDLRPRTELTEVHPDKLKSILANVRKQGFAVTDGESDIGLAGIAAPIFDGTGEPIGSVVVAGPSERIRPKIEEWSLLVRNAAQTLSAFSGYSPDRTSDVP